MDPRDIVRSKRDGRALSRTEIEAFMGAYVAQEIPDTLTSALLMAIFQRGMEERELVDWTRAMLESGERLELPGSAPSADKHSTGGVGDKVSIALAPAVAACGVAVPMISGRGLGHTAGTLDKLEAIPGLTTELSRARMGSVLEQAGAVIAAQADEIVPADRRLYALRDATGLVESVPLIASSILSKKLAEGLSFLVLDVKFGSGAFLADAERGAHLAGTMLGLARSFDLAAVAYQTSMEQPLGSAVGHALEVREAIACLRGGGPEDLRELVVTCGAEMLVGAGAEQERAAARERLEQALDGGDAQDAFARMVAAQGGDARVLEQPGLLPIAPGTALWLAPRSGVLDVVDCRRIGLAAAVLGGVRERPDNALDPAVGLIWLKRIGDQVRAGEAVCELYHREERGLREAEAHVAAAVDFDTGREAAPLVLGRLEA